MNIYTKSEIKKIISRINNYTAACIGHDELKPFVIVGPQGKKNNLRIYCFGGSVGFLGSDGIELLDPTKDIECEYGLIDKSYEKYLRRRYIDGRKHIHELNNEISEMYKEFLDNVNSEVSEKSCYVKEGETRAKYIPGLDEDFLKERNKGYKAIYDEILNTGENESIKYLDYVIAATYNKFMNASKNSASNDGERKIQTGIVKEFMGRDKSEGFIVYDMECDIKLEKSGFSKPDIMVFDGEKIGLFEIKYAGQSMKKGSSNSLTAHFDKFKSNIYEDADREELAKECHRRMNYLLQYGLINEEWKADIDKFEKKTNKVEDVSSLFFMGFLFVEGDGKRKEDNIAYVKREISTQLGQDIDERNDIDIRFCYAKESRLVFDISNTKLETMCMDDGSELGR